MAASRTPAPPSTPPLSTTALLRVLAAEIGEVAAECRSLETLVGEILASVPQGQSLARLQALDLIIQRVAGVGAVIETLADHAPLGWIDADRALGGVSLAAQAARLSGAAIADPDRPPGEAEIW